VKLACFLLIGACSSSSGSGLEDGGGSGGSGDPGTGTKTLYAGVGLSASMVAGGSESSGVDVVLARGMRGGAPVSGATVTLTAGGTTVTPTEGAIAGSYEASGFAWQPSWQLQVSSGSDQLQATIAAPGATTITSPANGATVAAGDLTVQWTDGFGAKAASTWADPGNGAQIVQLTDSGMGTVPVSATGVVTIYRQDAEPLDGGVANSLATAVSSYGVFIQVQ
jgi:hypothetical protein